MRKAALKTFLILFLGAMICASLSVFSYAHADDATDETKYPETFRFELHLSDICDYDMEDGSYIFASSEGVTVLVDEEKSTRPFSNATNVDIVDGVFYCMDGSMIYSSSDGVIWTSYDEQHDFESSRDSYETAEYYYNVWDGGISILNRANPSTTDTDTLAGFSVLRVYDERIFAIFEDSLYEITGTEAEKAGIYYTDYSAAENVSTGTASLSSWSEALENPGNLSFEVGTLAEGAFVSEIDLASISDDTFDVLDTFEITEESTPKAEDQVLILCRSGNAYVVAAGLSVYILRTDGVKNLSDVSVSPAEGSGTVSEPTLSSYLIPVICDAASKDDLDSAGDSTSLAEVQICGSLSADEFSFLYCDFYLVSYETDGGTRFGFVPERYVTIGNFGETLTEFEDENFSDDNYILTVVLILIVIALVLVAAGYIVFIATRSKKKGKASDEGDGDEQGRDEDK